MISSLPFLNCATSAAKVTLLSFAVGEGRTVLCIHCIGISVTRPFSDVFSGQDSVWLLVNETEVLYRMITRSVLFPYCCRPCTSQYRECIPSPDPFILRSVVWDRSRQREGDVIITGLPRNAWRLKWWMVVVVVFWGVERVQH